MFRDNNSDTIYKTCFYHSSYFYLPSGSYYLKMLLWFVYFRSTLGSITVRMAVIKKRLSVHTVCTGVCADFLWVLQQNWKTRNVSLLLQCMRVFYVIFVSFSWKRANIFWEYTPSYLKKLPVTVLHVYILAL